MFSIRYYKHITIKRKYAYEHQEQLKQTANTLSSQFMLIAVLSLISSVIEYAIILFPEALSIAHPFSGVALMIIYMSTLLVIGKALQNDELKDIYQNEYRLLHCLGAIYIIGLIFQMLVAR